jgi:hypothetical protein
MKLFPISSISLAYLFYIPLSFAESCNQIDLDSLRDTRDNPDNTLNVRLRSAKLVEICAIEKLRNESAKPGIVSNQNSYLNNKLVDEIQAQDTAITNDLESSKNFMGINLGVGVAISFPDKKAVDDAEIVNDVVVATSKQSNEARVILEFHNLIACDDHGKNTDYGCGPFAAIATKGDDLLGGVGLGWLWSWKSSGKGSSSAFSIGVGAILDNDVKDLADGFKVGEAPPSGETKVRFTTESRTSYLIFVSNTF